MKCRHGYLNFESMKWNVKHCSFPMSSEALPQYTSSADHQIDQMVLMPVLRRVVMVQEMVKREYYRDQDDS
jgi:hypothetical protein